MRILRPWMTRWLLVPDIALLGGIAVRSPFRPVSAARQQGSRLATPRNGYTAPLPSDGDVLVVRGRQYKDMPLAMVERIGAAVGEWRAARPSLWTRASHSATMLPAAYIALQACTPRPPARLIAWVALRLALSPALYAPIPTNADDGECKTPDIPVFSPSPVAATTAARLVAHWDRSW